MGNANKTVSSSPPPLQYMLDTNICIYLMKNHPPEIRKQLNKCPIGSVCISSIVLAELWFGVSKSQQKEANRLALNDFLRYCLVKDWPHQAAECYGEIRSRLQFDGKIIGGNDLLIAAHAKYNGAILVSNNLSEFERVVDLKLENWIK